jgi:hypothetical protein
MVTTQISTFAQLDLATPPEERIQIGGQVADSAIPPKPVPNAWVRLDSNGVMAVSDVDGRFAFQGVTRGAHVLRVRAVGFTDSVRAIQVPEPSGDYNVTLV